MAQPSKTTDANLETCVWIKRHVFAMILDWKELAELNCVSEQTMWKHSYTGGYISPRVRSVERDSKQEKQQQLVSKYFAKDASKSVIKRETLHEFVKQETKSETKSQVTRQNIQVEQAQQSGQIRKQEALMRREEFKAAKLEVTSTVDGKVLSTAGRARNTVFSVH